MEQLALIVYTLGTINMCWIHELRRSQLSYHFNLHSNPKKRHHFYPHFTDEMTEVLGGWGTCPMSPSKSKAKPRLEPSFAWLQGCVTTMQLGLLSGRRNPKDPLGWKSLVFTRGNWGPDMSGDLLRWNNQWTMYRSDSQSGFLNQGYSKSAKNSCYISF